jgi:quercetin dioxygenase-like cupin family protein
VEYSIDGQALVTYNAGDALMVPPETVHAVRNVGSAGAALLCTYVVEKGKPSSWSSIEDADTPAPRVSE